LALVNVKAAALVPTRRGPWWLDRIQGVENHARLGTGKLQDHLYYIIIIKMTLMMKEARKQKGTKKRGP
jgi:hypothetical protein